MKLDINKIEIKNISDNIFYIYHDNIILNFWTCKILCPFGIDNEYNKLLIKLELENDNIYAEHLKKVILHLENLIKKKLNIEDNEFKSIIKKRNGKCDILELRIKNSKNNILTKIEYQDNTTNYLKTIYDLPKQSYLKVQIEINGLWDYRTEKKENNKVGLIVYAKNITVLI
jgi:hypothetical protein